MIQMIVTHSCPDCGSEDLVKNGHDYKGSQKFHCKSCKRYGTLGAKRGKNPELKQQIYQAIQERLSWRGIERVFEVSRRTVQRWTEQWLAELPKLETSLAPVENGDVLELDELWSFVGSKAEQRWLWLALCRRSRQVVAFYVGDRSENSAIGLWLALPDDYRRLPSFSDRWEAYRPVFDLRKHQLVEKKSGATAHVERWFNTLRQRLGRFTRKTLAFSKRDDLHTGLLHLFIYHYNLSCIS
jgi:insertion element IS1 protein InsB